MVQDPKGYRTPGHERPNLLPNPLAMFCIGCRYPLRGLSGKVCPECGRAFDPKDATTYAPRAERVVVPYDAACALVFALPLAWVLLASLQKTSSRYRWGNSPLMNFSSGVFLGLLLLGLAVFCICHLILKNRDPETTIPSHYCWYWVPEVHGPSDQTRCCRSMRSPQARA